MPFDPDKVERLSEYCEMCDSDGRVIAESDYDTLLALYKALLAEHKKNPTD